MKNRQDDEASPRFASNASKTRWPFGARRDHTAEILFRAGLGGPQHAPASSRGSIGPPGTRSVGAANAEAGVRGTRFASGSTDSATDANFGRRQSSFRLEAALAAAAHWLLRLSLGIGGLGDNAGRSCARVRKRHTYCLHCMGREVRSNEDISGLVHRTHFFCYLF